MLVESEMAGALRLLLVDDDLDLCALMREFLESRGLACDTAHTGPRGLALAMEDRHDLVLLDGMLPGLDGFEVLRQLRLRSSIPVIMLTARTAQADRVAGLDAGADDYIPKPFGPEEMLARIRAVLRRARPSAPAGSAAYERAGLRLAPATREAWAGGQPLDLTAAEFAILDLLLRAAGRVVSRDEIAAALFQREASPFERALDVHISHLRKKLGPRRDDIITIRGTGYQFRLGELAEEA